MREFMYVSTGARALFYTHSGCMWYLLDSDALST